MRVRMRNFLQRAGSTTNLDCQFAKKIGGGIIFPGFFCPSVRAARPGAGIQRHSLVSPWDRNTTVPAHKNARAHAQLPAPRWKQHSSGLLICEKNRRGDYFPRFSSAPRSEPQGMALYGFFDEIDAFFPHHRFPAAKLKAKQAILPETLTRLDIRSTQSAALPAGPMPPPVFVSFLGRQDLANRHRARASLLSFKKLDVGKQLHEWLISPPASRSAFFLSWLF